MFFFEWLLLLCRLFVFFHDAVTNGTSLHVILPPWTRRKSVYTEAGHGHSQDLLLLTHNGKITRDSQSTTFGHFPHCRTVPLSPGRKQLSCMAVLGSNNARFTPLLSLSLCHYPPTTTTTPHPPPHPLLGFCPAFPSRVCSSLFFSSPSQFILIISIGNRWSEDEGEFPAFKTRMMN